ncbi:putative transposase [Desulfosarcina variabilis str. Montpellier]
MAARSVLIDKINNHLQLIERHRPYYESAHILDISYNYPGGGSCLQDIKLLRNDQAWLDALGASIILAPTTAGDFLHRFNAEQITELIEVINTIRSKIWQKQPASFLREAIIDADRTICAADGECKQGMDISYNGHEEVFFNLPRT